MEHKEELLLEKKGIEEALQRKTDGQGREDDPDEEQLNAQLSQVEKLLEEEQSLS